MCALRQSSVLWLYRHLPDTILFVGFRPFLCSCTVGTKSCAQHGNRWSRFRVDEVSVEDDPEPGECQLRLFRFDLARSGRMRRMGGNEGRFGALEQPAATADETGSRRRGAGVTACSIKGTAFQAVVDDLRRLLETRELSEAEIGKALETQDLPLLRTGVQPAKWVEQVGRVMLTLSNAMFNFSRWKLVSPDAGKAGDLLFTLNVADAAELPAEIRIVLEGCIESLFTPFTQESIEVRSRRPTPDTIHYQGFRQLP